MNPTRIAINFDMAAFHGKLRTVKKNGPTGKSHIEQCNGNWACIPTVYFSSQCSRTVIKHNETMT